MKVKLLLFAIVSCISLGMQAQEITTDEIVDNYFENTGGKDAWEKIEGLRMSLKFNQGGVDIPVEVVSLKGGKTYTSFTVQGQSFMQNVFDGTNLWATNFQSMQPEKLDQETTDNMKLETNDFPDPLLNYKEKKYTLELVGTETMEGTETYKLKLTKEPKTVNGEKKEDVVYYYFDTENFVPIAQESEIKQGPAAGQIQLITMSDYQEVEGIYFPFSMTQGIKGQPGNPIKIEALELNPEVEETIFAFPESK